MNSPRSGFRRAAIASWALAGIGAAGVVGASTLAYGDTVKPAATDLVEQTSAGQQAGPTPGVPPTAPVTMPAVPPPPPPTTDVPTPETSTQTTVDQAPVRTFAPEPTYTRQTTVEQAPATQQSAAPTAPRTTQRRALTPATVVSPNFSPHVSRSRGS
jgi:hypothetical protein